METLWQSLGARPPREITQEAFDFDRGHLIRLTELRPGERPQARDLWDYTQDLRHAREIQTLLLIYVLPFCLHAWREDLCGVSDEYGGFVEHFYPALADRKIFESQLNSKQTTAVSEFMRRTILEEIDNQRGLSFSGAKARPYRWVRALTTYGVLRPDMDILWKLWWSLETVGRATAAMQYISCLMYSEYDNPIFAPWTGDSGGGPPCLWEFEGHLYEHHWSEPNVAFLREFLNVGRVSDVLTQAVTILAGQPEQDMAAAIRDDLPLCAAILRTRCAELPALLGTKQAAGTLLTWTK